MKIFLLGLPGSGKSTLGKALSAQLRIPFVDLDFEIEKSAGRKITEIFDDSGEIVFRKMESAELNRWCTSSQSFVMALGGGTPCFMENMDMVNGSGKSIFLDVAPEIIVGRIQGRGITERPLLAAKPEEELSEKIATLRSERISFYQRANFTFSGKSISSDEIADVLKLK